LNSVLSALRLSLYISAIVVVVAVVPVATADDGEKYRGGFDGL